MARPKSDDKRSAILDAATVLISIHGVGAATAMIAKDAGVSTGSLFTYFETKKDLLNQLYVSLKMEMASAALDDIPTNADLRDQLSHMWSRWLIWATKSPEKRRTLAHLGVAEEISPESRRTTSETTRAIATIVECCRANGPMRDVPLDFVMALMNALADTTIDFMINDPPHADQHSAAGLRRSGG